MKRIKFFSSVILIIVATYIIIGEIVFPEYVPDMGEICEILPSDSFVKINPDGSREPFEVPGKADGDIVFETVLPDELGRDKDALCLRGMDMRIYIDGKLRENYEVQDNMLLGDRSSECYVMTSLYPEDSGKTLTVYYAYNAGVVYEVFVGNRIGVLSYLFKNYGAELFVGLAVLILGLICYLAALGYQRVHKRYLELRDLSLGVIIGAIWVLSNSVFRQLYSRNISIMADIPFLMVMIMPLPFLVFINSLQNGRHYKLIRVALDIELLDFVVCAVLFVSGLVPLAGTFILAASSAAASIGIIAYTMIRDTIDKKIRPYRYVAFGFMALGIAAIVQILIYLFAHNGVFSGLFMALGLLAFIICAMIHTIRQIIRIQLAAKDALDAGKIKDEFLANMSHEIRTPLNGILGMNEMILRDTKERRTRKYAVNIKGAGETLLALINDILDLSKIQAGRLTLIPAKYDASSLLNDVLNMTRPKALEKDLDFKFDVSENVPATLRGDEIRVKQILLNIINNAVKYTSEGYVHVKIGVRNSDIPSMTTLRVEVSDSGEGIKPEDMGKLFKSFQRIDEKSNKKIEGTGLGLHITNRLVNMMDGRIEVESEYGKGSTFRIFLPQEVASDDTIGDFSKAVQEYVDNMKLSETTLYIPDAKILVVDDNEMNLDVMEGLLRDTKAKVEYALSGEECLSKLREKKDFDIIMLDQMMPEMSGEETLSIIQKENLASGTPVVALTADAIVGAKENYLNMGFTDYLSKPVHYEELEEQLKKHISKDKQKERAEEKGSLPILLLWGTDPDRLRDEKEKLSENYKCVCVVGSKAMERYVEKNHPERVMRVY